MQTPTIPADEGGRLASLHGLGLLDTDPEERFDRHTRLARRLFGVQIALVTLVAEKRQWFKSRQGLAATETSRDVSFCAHAVAERQMLIVPDTMDDPRFSDNPLVTAEPHIRFYAGCPLRAPDGQTIGTICLIDDAPRAMSTEDADTLRDLAGMVEQEFIALQMATTDALTGLGNRLGFQAVGGHALTMCRRLALSATLLYFDLDGFKLINDTHGHAEGDRALRMFADVLLGSFRDSDIAVRVGGDEFAVLCVGMDVSRITVPLGRLDELLFASTAGLPYLIRYSVGAVAFDGEPRTDIDGMIAAADRSMYDAKSAADRDT